MNDLDQRLSSLSPEKRALLALRLREKRGPLAAEVAPPARREPSPALSARRRTPAPRRAPGLGFSLFYFSSNAEPGAAESALRLFFVGAEFADRNGFEAVWVPERHFHEFGGLFPNPAVAAAHLAARTAHLRLRAGSVVLPLHHPLRVAEEWALVDNYSGGRVGLAFASGWHANDFALNPVAYARRREAMFEEIATVARLWRGERVSFRDGAGQEVGLEIFPKPIQPELPVWITAAGNPETFVRAGAMGANLLTHLLGQSVEKLAERIACYRQARADHGHDPRTGQVTLMLHTFLGDDVETVRRTVRDPFCNYLRSFTELLENLGRSLGIDVRGDSFSEADMASLLTFAFDRYFNTSGLFGTPDSCLVLTDRLAEIGVDEVACLVDFGVETEAVLASLEPLAELKRRTQERAAERRSPLAEPAEVAHA